MKRSFCCGCAKKRAEMVTFRSFASAREKLGTMKSEFVVAEVFFVFSLFSKKENFYKRFNSKDSNGTTTHERSLSLSLSKNATTLSLSLQNAFNSNFIKIFHLFLFLFIHSTFPDLRRRCCLRASETDQRQVKPRGTQTPRPGRRSCYCLCSRTMLLSRPQLCCCCCPGEMRKSTTTSTSTLRRAQTQRQQKLPPSAPARSQSSRARSGTEEKMLAKMKELKSKAPQTKKPLFSSSVLSLAPEASTSSPSSLRPPLLATSPPQGQPWRRRQTAAPNTAPRRSTR